MGFNSGFKGLKVNNALYFVYENGVQRNNHVTQLWRGQQPEEETSQGWGGRGTCERFCSEMGGMGVTRCDAGLWGQTAGV